MFCCLLSIVLPVLTFLYPAWQSITAITQKDAKAQNRWLFYWTFYGFILLVEKLLFFLTWIPGWCLVRTLFSVWLWHSEYNGAQYLYHNYVVKIQPHIEEKYQKISQFLPLEQQKKKEE